MNEEKRIKELVSKHSEEIMGLRETIHRHPETGKRRYHDGDRSVSEPTPAVGCRAYD